MRAFLRTAAVAAISSITTAGLFTACSIQRESSIAVPLASPQAPLPTLDAQFTSARAAPLAQTVGAANPAVAVYQQNGGSVVNITSTAVRTRSGVQQQQPQGIGSGFFIDTDGRIVTNDHVVQDANQLAVTLRDRTTVTARLVGRDPDNDLAVIQVDPSATDFDGRPIRDRITPVTLGDSEQVTVGETAIAIGSSFGLAQTVTEGIVSARRSPGEESAVPGSQLELLGGAIQTDAAVNPGNSGGPLFNAAGHVIGVNSAILSQSGRNEGVGFAIPINVVKRVAPQLIQTSRYRHPQVGVTSFPLSDLSPQAKGQLRLEQTQRGLLVQQVSAGAQEAGVQPGTRRATIGSEVILVGGDIIIGVDGQPVVTGGDLRGWLENNKHPGDQATLTVLRDGQRLDIPVTLTERPADTR